MNTPQNQFAKVLQSAPVFCNLQTGCKLLFIQINELGQFAVCRKTVCKPLCNLVENIYESMCYDQFAVCRDYPSYYVGEGTEVPSPLRREVCAEFLDESDGRVMLALDLGTTTGWALRDRERQISHGYTSFRPNRFEGGGMRFLRFKRWLTEIKAITGDIHAVYFEEVRRHAGVDAAHIYGGLMATLTAWCEHHDIPYQGVPVGTIKKHATGKGNAGKDEVIAAMQVKGHPVTDDNEADALALLHWAMDQEV